MFNNLKIRAIEPFTRFSICEGPDKGLELEAISYSWVSDYMLTVFARLPDRPETADYVTLSLDKSFLN